MSIDIGTLCRPAEPRWRDVEECICLEDPACCTVCLPYIQEEYNDDY